MLRAACIAFAGTIVATIALRAPDAAALVVERAFGGRIVHEGRIPLYVGSEIFSVSHAWTGGLGWLGALAAWAAGGAGTAFATFATCAFAFVAFAFVALRAARRAPPAFALGAAALAAICAADALRDGGGIENAAFAAALFFFLDRPTVRGTVLVVALTIVWCNASPVGVLAPVLAASAALAAYFERRPAREQRLAQGALVGTALATLVNPAGLSFASLAAEALRIDRGLEGLVPYHPADVSEFGYRAGFTLATIAALAFGAGRLRVGDAFLWVGAVLLALANGAFLAIFGVLVAPLLAASAAAILHPDPIARDDPSPPVRVRIVAALAAFAFAIAGGAASIVRRPQGAEAEMLGRSLAADRRPHRLFCATIDWCGVAEAGGAPFVSGFMDGRVEAFPASVRTEELGIAKLKDAWRDELEQQRVDAVLVRKDRSFATLAGSGRGWRLAGSTATLALYVRRP